MAYRLCPVAYAIAVAVSASGVAACGAERTGEAAAVPQGGWAELLQDARMHDTRAAEQDLVAQQLEHAPYIPEQWDCGDQTLFRQATTGILPVTDFEPCLDLHWAGAQRLRHQAARDRAAARVERARAAELVGNATAACGGLPSQQRAASIFARRGVVTHVVPLGSGDTPQGVAVVLVAPGLTADGVRRDIACRQAQLAMLGHAPDLTRGDPTLVADAQVSVRDTPRGVEVEVLTPNADAARRAIARAEGRPEPSRALEASR
jgi:hypothetical protein